MDGTVGFIGVGAMGAPMVEQLAKAGMTVLVHDLSAEALAPFRNRTDGVGVADSASVLGAAAAIVITMLPDGAAVRRAAMGPEGFAHAMSPGDLLVDMSTSYPVETTDLGRDLHEMGLKMADAPVSGGVRRAVTGELTIMAGGDGADLDRAEPVLSAMGTVQRTGALGSGHAMKVLNNYLSASGLAAACEAVLVGQRFGLDPDQMAGILNTSTGRNNATEVKLTQHVNNRKFATGFTMGLMAKDLAMARRLSEEMGVGRSGLAPCADLFSDAVAEIGPAADHTEIMRLIETRAAGLPERDS